MNKEILKQRTKCFALRIIRMVEMLPAKQSAKVIGNQVLRSGTSIGANYAACCRAKSTRDFINKLKIIEEEAAETIFWLELLEESGMFHPEKLIPLKIEANELLSIMVASIKTTKSNARSATPKSKIVNRKS
ncbi:MAG: four helix bundle protein [Bacteroidetes bacterium]|nr:four helix bundle protein [Bacteroidota bacterium]